MFCYKYPCKIVVVEDNLREIQSLKAALSFSFKNTQYFTSFQEAEVFLSQLPIYNYPKIFSEIVNTEMNNDIKVNINMLKICQLKDDKEKYKNVSVVISDYSLPDGDGLEVLNSIKDKDVYKILYTGVADEKIAIDSFNKGYINAFVKKSDPTYLLIDEIKKGGNQYFYNKSKSIIDIINSSSSGDTILMNSIYQDIINNIILEKFIVEVYLLDTLGSYLLINEKGETYILLLSDKLSIDAQLQCLEQVNNCKKYINDIKNGNRFLYLLKDMNNVDNLQKIIFKAKAINNRFLYSLIKGNELMKYIT
ncbi:response regulator [Rickettsiales endosymbiont of Trichoplax sp. H2]|uniref:response regulator n=1 Tax=Rickettsiales endosymbiont of Trichoplax sp. H2 TaxID=2021221 RepID=UPI0012B2F006|nr:response regulator [Rickettsiales endosymbiont of Trichoplax sp. H2]MSO14463.1 hypothetical protein [Rickettsiales endosymbiont of Trichoplax sp. H2]